MKLEALSEDYFSSLPYGDKASEVIVAAAEQADWEIVGTNWRTIDDKSKRPIIKIWGWGPKIRSHEEPEGLHDVDEFGTDEHVYITLIFNFQNGKITAARPPWDCPIPLTPANETEIIQRIAEYFTIAAIEGWSRL